MPAENDQLQPPPPPPRRRRRRRLVRWTFVSLLILLILAAAAVHIILFTDVPRRIVVAEVQRQLGLNVSAKSMRTGWFGRTELRDVTLSLPLAEQSLLDVPTLRVKHTMLLPLLLGVSINIDSLELDHPVLHVRQDLAGGWNVRQAVELVARTAGSKQAQQSATSKNPLRLPALRVVDAKIYITDNTGMISPLEQVNVTGWRDGLLVYRYDADIHDRLHAVGELAPTARWDHEVRFHGSDLDELLAPFLRDLPPRLNADGTWRGKLNADGAEGRLELTALSTTADDASASGVALLNISGASLELRPERLLVKYQGQEVRLVSGRVTLEPAAIRAEDLILASNDGQAIVGGRWNRADGSANLRAAWRQIAYPAGMSQSGTIEASLHTPWPGHPQIDATLTASSRTAPGTIDTSVQLKGEGDSFRNIDWSATFEHLSWSGRRQFAAKDFSVRLRSRGEQLILDDLVMNNQPELPLSARGQIDLKNQDHWWLWIYGSGIALHRTIGSDEPLPPLTMNLNLWGDTAYVQLEDFYARLGDLQAMGNGRYDAHRPKPFDAALEILHTPITSEPELSEIIKGSMTARLALLGTIDPLELELSGAVHGRGLEFLHRKIGELDARISGGANDNGINVQTTAVPCLGGSFRFAGDWPGRRDQPARIRIEANNVPLREIGQFMGRSDLRGIGNAHATLMVPRPRLSRVRAAGTYEARDVAVPPFLADQAIGQFTLDGGMLRVDVMHLTRHDGTGSAKVELAVNRPGVLNIQASAKDWPIDAPAQQAAAAVTGQTQLTVDIPNKTASGPLQFSAHLTAGDRPVGTLRVDADLDQHTLNAKSIEAEMLGGSARGHATVNTSDLVRSTARLEWNDIDTAEFSAWFPRLKGLIGRSTGALALAPTGNDRHALGPSRLDASLQMVGGQFQGMKIGDGSLTTFFDADRFVTENAKFNLADGIFTVFARASRRPGETTSMLVSAEYQQLDLDQLVHAMDPQAKSMPGRVQGKFTLAGDPSRPRQMFGEAMARITECDLVHFAPVAALYDSMHVSFGTQKPTGVATVDGRLEGETLAITTARIFNRGVEIRGLGELRDIWQVPNSPIQGSAVGSAQPLANIKLPFMADVNKIFSVLQANVTSVRFSGTLKKPEVVQSTLDDVGQAMRSLLLGDVEAQTRGSAQH